MELLDSSGNPAERRRVQIHPVGDSLAKQSFQKECDINNIMRKFEKTGQIPHLNNHTGGYGNYIGFEDYHTSLNKILAADEAFASLPAKVRTKFQNDPAHFLEFAQNPENLNEMREMGLAPPAPPEPSTDETPAEGGTPSPKDGGPPAGAAAAALAVSTAQQRAGQSPAAQ